MDTNYDIRVYPIDEPKGKTLAYASLAIGGLAAIRNIRVVDGKNGMFVTMPQTQGKDGMYHDIAFPLSGDLRKEITEAIIDEFRRQSDMPPGERGYGKMPADESSINADDVAIDARVFPVKEQRSDTIAFASAGLDETMVIRSIRIKSSDNGLSVEMPQAKDKDGNLYDVAFPLSGELRTRVSKSVLGAYREKAAEFKKSIGEKLAEGKEISVALAVAEPTRLYAANSSPGLGE